MFSAFERNYAKSRGRLSAHFVHGTPGDICEGIVGSCDFHDIDQVKVADGSEIPTHSEIEGGPTLGCHGVQIGLSIRHSEQTL
jgi:hypothetical protein